MLRRIKKWFRPCEHALVRIASNHLHFEKGEHQTTTYCFSGVLEVCRKPKCRYEKFIGNPAFFVVGCQGEVKREVA